MWIKFKHFCILYHHDLNAFAKTRKTTGGHVSFEWLGGAKWTLPGHIANQLSTRYLRLLYNFYNFVSGMLY